MSEDTPKTAIEAELKRRTKAKEIMPTHVVFSPEALAEVRQAGWDTEDEGHYCGLIVSIDETPEAPPYTLVGIA